MEEPYFIFDQPADLHRLSEMVFVEGGTFHMGSEEDDIEANDWEKPAHDVRLDSFYIAKYPVTQAIWETVMGSNPSDFKGPNRPVENVSWNDIIQEFLPKLNKNTERVRPEGTEYRLPTEAQWEYAARGGKYWNKYPFKYSGSDKLNEVAWYNENSHNETKPVGLKTPNLLDIHDMSGNVWEWCEDWYSSDFYKHCKQDGVVENPCNRSMGTNRVRRGGSWDYDARLCRSTFRYFSTPSNRYINIGFRLALVFPSV